MDDLIFRLRTRLRVQRLADPEPQRPGRLAGLWPQVVAVPPHAVAVSALGQLDH